MTRWKRLGCSPAILPALCGSEAGRIAGVDCSGAWRGPHSVPHVLYGAKQRDCRRLRAVATGMLQNQLVQVGLSRSVMVRSSQVFPIPRPEPAQPYAHRCATVSKRIANSIRERSPGRLIEGKANHGLNEPRQPAGRWCIVRQGGCLDPARSVQPVTQA